MGDHGSSPTCLSAEPHGPAGGSHGTIRDHAAHYFGCIEIADRVNYLSREKNSDLWNHEIQIEAERLQQRKPTISEDERRKNATAKVEARMKSLAVSIEAQYKRTDILRKALSEVRCSQCEGQYQNKDAKDQANDPSSCDLVHIVSHSHEKWKNSDSYRKGIEIIRAWKRHETSSAQSSDVEDENLTNSPSLSSNDRGRITPEREEARKIIRDGHTDVDYAFEEDKDTPSYKLERDMNGYLIQWKILRPGESRKKLESSTPINISPTSLNFAFPPQLPSLPPSPLPAPRPRAARASSEATSHALWTTQSTSYFEPYTEQEKYLEPLSENIDDYRFKGKFPDQRLTLQNLLDPAPKRPEPQDVILSRDRPGKGGRVRYFHIPHNNMKWLEEAIARYFNEERPLDDGTYRNPQLKTHSRMVLRPEYWRGQQHGGRRTLVHARHMRAICERISSRIWEVEDNPDNLVLFMPYLHWEEDRKRDKMAKIIDKESERNREEHEKQRNTARAERVQKRTYKPTTTNDKQVRNLLEPDLCRIKHHDKVSPIHKASILSAWKKNAGGNSNGKHAKTMADVAGGFAMQAPVEHEHDSDGHNLWSVPKLKCSDHGRLQVENKLGQFLLDSARLYEAMSMYRDQCLVEKYLHHDPPLHPRRTLDQSYYWTLKTTKARDRDQVVYRGTTMDERNIHRFRECRGDPAQSCKDKKPFWRSAAPLTPEQNPDFDVTGPPGNNFGRYKWDGHWKKTDEDGCDHCRDEIRKVSRIVMVDQLWMWILDKRTIITSFPKRYGANKSDPSGVHKSIRTRIKHARKNQIRSVFDVALIILDECSNTFFDRTKTPDRHPQVMDIFAESIGTLQNKQTVSFQHLWHWTEQASKVYHSKSAFEDTSHLHVPLLNINPEGKLQREIKDIIDELDIMIHVNGKQREVIKRFVKHVENIYDPSGKWRDETLSPDGNRDYFRSRSMSRGGEEIRSTEEARKQEEREKDEFTWFRKQAYDLISDVDDRMNELESLRKSAETTSQGIKDLLDLKQQQASILQAWQSVRQADESVRQGRSVMIFTIVTIIFTWILVTFGFYTLYLKIGEWKKDWTTSDKMLKRLEKKVEGMRSQVKDKRRAERERADAEVLQQEAGDGKIKDQRRTEHKRVNAEVWRKSEGDGKV
ncbi:hypothetical protein CSIM01_06083 [Colletotrichum simmondsii]|uniref:Ankyrin repeat protein n=1 Tax=Colletotrichum simmondsii TaxID=703756 RepID=A0A135SSU3_9PEZI|nr:hypothetical protein CSIM01_06083 [Colletotrichum simmondsii]